MPDPTGDERWTQIRYDYEHTERPIADICAEHGISPNTLRDLVRRWRWTKRRAPIPREGPPPVAARLLPLANDRRDEGPGTIDSHEPPHPSPLPPGEREQAGPGTNAANSDGQASGALHTMAGGGAAGGDPASIAPRLQCAVARVLPAIEAIIARLGAQPLRPREMEQTARALGALTRTLRELNALLSQHPAPAAVDDDPVPEDMDAFRNELARRIRAFIAARRGEEAAAEDTAPADR